MINYLTDEDNIVIQVDKSQKVALEGYKRTNKDICPGMIDNLDDTFSAPVIVPTPPTKQELLNNLIVTISTSKRFYADPESRTDLMATIIEAQEQGAVATSITSWKTPDGIMNVTLAELKEASKKALETKAQIIGVV